jgi:translation elongation factor EF-Tu-like GTPase
MHAAEAPDCKTREILRARLRADLKVYADSRAVLQRSMGVTFEKAHLRVETARRAYQVARRKLNDHLATHGCE